MRTRAPAHGLPALLPALLPAVPALLALAIHLPSIGGPWAMDDDAALRGHPVVRGDAPLVEAFTREFWGRPLADGWSSSYRPLATLLWATLGRVSDGPLAPRLAGVLLFAVLCATFTLAAGRWLGGRGAVAAGVLAAVWPAHAANAASIVGAADTLSALGGVAATWLAMSSLDAARRGAAAQAWRRGTLASVAYLLGMLAKESLALWPLLALWLVWLGSRDDRAGPRVAGRDAAAAWLPGTIVGACYLWARHAALPVTLPSDFVAADNILLVLGPLDGWLTRLALVGRHLGWLVAVGGDCVDHTYADVLAPRWADVGDVAAMTAGAAALWVVARDAHRAILGRSPGLWVATALAYAVIGQWVTPLSVIAADRLLLWPSLWAAAAAVATAHALAVRWPAPRLWTAAGLVAVAGWAGLAFDRSQDWTDRVRLHQRSVERCPAAIHNRRNLAHELARRGDQAGAVWHMAVAALGRSAWPGRFEVPPAVRAFDAAPETIDDALAALPGLFELPPSQHRRFWLGLANALTTQRLHDAAGQAQALARATAITPRQPAAPP